MLCSSLFIVLQMDSTVYTHKMIRCVLLSLCCRWTLLCQLTNWFNAYCLVRTYSNSLEAPCTIMGVFYWLKSTRTLLQPVETLESSQQAQVQGIQAVHHTACQQHDQPKVPHSLVSTPTPSVHNVEQNALMTHRQKALWAAAIGVLFRPSSVLFWVPLGESLPNDWLISSKGNMQYTCSISLHEARAHPRIIRHSWRQNAM